MIRKWFNKKWRRFCGKIHGVKENVGIIGPDIDTIEQALHEAQRYHLENEVIVYALKYMKENSKLTIQEAMMLGLREWVK